MSIRVSGGMEEDGVVVGNAFDKYGSRNPAVRWMMRGFSGSLFELVARAAPTTIHEVGCGEGYWVCQWVRAGIAARGSDFSSKVVALARENAVAEGISLEVFQVRSIYSLEFPRDTADLLVCCEVFEHLEDPRAALAALKEVVADYLILSVPREPLWRLLNMLRLKYLPSMGNTPGHIQHWTKRGFIRLVSDVFEVVTVRSPWPWTMLLCRPRQ